MTKHTLSVLVENKPGVLARIAGLFSRRGFNIDTLAVGPTDDPSISRITLTLDGAIHPIDQVTKQLHKLVNVNNIRDLEPEETIARERCVQLRAAIDRLSGRQREHILREHDAALAELAERPGFTFEVTVQRATEIVGALLSQEAYGLLVGQHGWTTPDWTTWTTRHLTADLFPPRTRDENEVVAI